MRVEGPTRKFGDLTAALEAEWRAYHEKVKRGEAEPPKRDANGKIIPSPSTRKPSMFDGLNLTQDTPAEIG